jgi:hypothetical protein
MFQEKLRSYFEKTPVIHYMKQVETVTVGEIIIDVAKVITRPYACDGAHCLSMKPLSNHLEDYGLTFYNEVAAYGDCCRGPVVFISDEERQRIAAHLDGIVPHMSQEGQFIVREYLRQQGPENKAEAFAETARCSHGQRAGEAMDFAKVHTIWGDQCIFRTLDHDGIKGRVRCAIHSYTLAAKLSYLDVKPVDCWFWPLALVPLYTGKYFLTLHTEETRHFTEESESYANKRCIADPIPGSPFVYQTFKDELTHVFGPSWYDALTLQAAAYHEPKGTNAENRSRL